MFDNSGLPSAALCTWGTGLANAAIFALIFPSYIIMAMHARPAPTDPYNPTPPIPSSRPEQNDIIRHPSPFIPIRLPIFAVVIWINDAIIRVLNFIGGRPIVRHKGAARGRSFSDSTESAEDGAVQMEMKPYSRSGTPSQSSSSKPVRATSGRINIGTRRKLD
ncbi:hypothetical protein NLJ89_g5582 [Agrocybe chaxingu]|uniref:Uncharacterized protein n=1 Tax=Agrocybe chaxingu TaxID=84603 RepID=A0A9W8K0A6_9AGAR|nr:hypothetical protein NLJ89_g5582 [Agrocybe chaxingu]